MATIPTRDPENKVHLEPDAEKAEEIQNEYRYQADRADSVSPADNDAHVKELTRKLLFKLDTRYALFIKPSCCQIGHYSHCCSCIGFFQSLQPFFFAPFWTEPT